MSNSILFFVSADATALLFLGALGRRLPRALGGLGVIGMSGVGALLCLLVLLSKAASSALELPIGPPSLHMHLVLDPVSAWFLFVVFLCGTSVAAFSVGGESRTSASWLPKASAAARREISLIALCLAGLSLLLLAADAVTLAIGSALAGAAISLPSKGPPLTATFPTTEASPAEVASRPEPAGYHWAFLPAVLLLISVLLLAAGGGAPRFDAIRSILVSPGRATATVAFAAAATAAMLRRDVAPGDWARDALMAGAVLPCTAYLLIRLVIDLPGTVAAGWWGFALAAIGGMISIVPAWQAAQHPDLCGAVACLARRQAGLAVVGLGLTVIARAADLPDAASCGLAATLLLSLGGGVAGTLGSLSAYALGHGAGSWRVLRLGGLLHSMPVASVSLAASLLSLSALAPGVGFAALWLLFQAILSAPRTGGLVFPFALACIAMILALSAAIATAASVRLVGIVLLSRPRSVRGSAAREVAAKLRPLLLSLCGMSITLGAIPGLVLKIVAAPVIAYVTGANPGGRGAEWITLSASTSTPGYSALPTLALLTLATGSVVMIVRRFRKDARVTDIWSDGLAPSPDLPFGDPLSQSAGGGFLPALQGPPILGSLSDGLRRLLMAPRTSYQLPSTRLGLWAILFAFSALLLVHALFDRGGSHG